MTRHFSPQLAAATALHAPARPPERLHCASAGQGTPVVCLHSSTGSHAQWRGLAGVLQQHARVLTPDLHGHGRSPAWPARAGNILAADAQAVLALAGEAMAESGSEGFHLVGHSYGAALALRIALRQPRLVRSLTLYEPVAFGCLRRMAPGDGSFEEIEEVAGTVAALVHDGELAAASRTFLAYWAGLGAWNALGAEQREAVCQRIPAVPLHFAALFAATWGRADLAALTMPTLLLHGEHTRAPTRRVAELLADALPRVRVRSIEGAGHLGPITHQGVVTRCIAGHVVAQLCLPAAAEREPDRVAA